MWLDEVGLRIGEEEIAGFAEDGPVAVIFTADHTDFYDVVATDGGVALKGRGAGLIDGEHGLDVGDLYGSLLHGLDIEYAFLQVVIDELYTCLSVVGHGFVGLVDQGRSCLGEDKEEGDEQGNERY
jgi:hypothetical protein